MIIFIQKKLIKLFLCTRTKHFKQTCRVFLARSSSKLLTKVRTEMSVFSKGYFFPKRFLWTRRMEFGQPCHNFCKSFVKIYKKTVTSYSKTFFWTRRRIYWQSRWTYHESVLQKFRSNSENSFIVVFFS